MALMTEEEPEECPERLKGVSVPVFEYCPNLTVSEDFDLERE